MRDLKSSTKSNNNKTINLGIQVLRMILAFLIVVIHCHKKKNVDIRFMNFAGFNLKYYVPSFFVISFYFTYNIFSKRNIIKIKQRFLRILIPYIIWPIIFFIEYIIYNSLRRKKIEDIYKRLYYQLLIGCGIHGVFWYLFNLIFLSIFFIIIIIIFKKVNLFIFLFLYIIVAFFYYLDCNKFIFPKNNYSIYIYHSIKPISKSLVYSISGYFLGSIHILNKSKKFRIFIIIILLSLCFLIKNNQKILKIISKIFIIDLICISLFIYFSLFPFDNIKSSVIIYIINKITKYTGGIYYLHPKINNFISKFLKLGDLKECIIIYFCSYLACFFGSIIFKKSNLKYLFC